MDPKSNAALLGRLVLSVVLVATIAAVIVFTWLGLTGEHVFSPDWHPHARFHGAQLVGFVVALSLGGLWLLWRRAAEPRVMAWIVATMTVCFWGGEFFAFLIPGTGPSPDPANPNTFRLLGFQIHGNLFFSGVMIVLSLLGGVLAGSPAAARTAAASRSR